MNKKTNVPPSEPSKLLLSGHDDESELKAGKRGKIAYAWISTIAIVIVIAGLLIQSGCL